MSTLKWIPVSARRKPRLYDTILIARNKGVTAIVSGFWDGENFRVMGLAGIQTFVEPTHWAELPDPEEIAT